MDIMLDLETLSTDQNGVILSIGAVAFSLGGDNQLVGIAPFYETIDVFSSLMAGFTIKPDTLEWWQDDRRKDAQKAITDKPTVRPQTAFSNFVDWFAELPNATSVTVWARSPSFDCVHLRHAMEVVGIPAPWSFRNERDVRTIIDVADRLTPPHTPQVSASVGVGHSAVDDCLTQIRDVQAAARMILGTA